MGAFPAAEHGNGRRQQHGHGGGFHTAGSGAGGAANQHENGHQSLTGLAHGVEVRRVESGSTGRHRLEQGQKNPPPQGFPPKLEEEEIDGGQDNEQGRHGENDFALHPVFPQMVAVGADIVPGEEADAAHHNQGHNGEIHHRGPGVGHEG